MNHRPQPDEAVALARTQGSDVLPLIAFVFVVLALATLAVTPALILQRISRSTAQVTSTILPAYEALRNLGFAMERRTAASRSLFLTGDPRYRDEVSRATAAETASLQTVLAVVPRLGDQALGHVSELQVYMAQRDSLVEELLATGPEIESYRAALPRFDALSDSTLLHLVGLQEELAEVAETLIEREARRAAQQQALLVVLGGLAMAAALAVGWFTLQQRRLRRGVQRALGEANRARAVAVRQREELERAAESRARLLRGVTHDVKNPLGAAKGYLQLLNMEVRGPLLPEQAPLVEGVGRSIDGALAILADLLDLARADSGGLPVHRVEVNLATLARNAVEDHRSAAEAAGHVIHAVVAADPIEVYVDPARVQQVLGNLLSNAIKYTPPPGRITVSAGRQGDGAGTRAGEWATMRVSDTGPGIPLEQREAIFDEFSRLDEGSAQKGHGLGLAIARRVARLLDGDLTVEGQPGEGAIFVLWLPLRRSDRAAREDAARARSSGLTPAQPDGPGADG